MDISKKVSNFAAHKCDRKRMMKAKRFLMMMTLLLIVGSVNAQKIDPRLTRLLEKNEARCAPNRITQRAGETPALQCIHGAARRQ